MTERERIESLNTYLCGLVNHWFDIDRCPAYFHLRYADNRIDSWIQYPGDHAPAPWHGPESDTEESPGE